MAIRVLVVDDSLFMRALVSDLLKTDPDIEVAATAQDGLEALRLISKVRPDVITLDLNMPGLSGLATLRRLMAEHPVPVVVLSAHSKKDADIVLECLHEGAVGFVLKPSGELSLDIEAIRSRLLHEVKAAAGISADRIRSLKNTGAIQNHPANADAGLVVIGASTGGPQTLEAFLPAFPPDLKTPFVVAQHVPSRQLTESLAARLNRFCSLLVKVPQDQEPVQSGTVYLAPGEFRCTLQHGESHPPDVPSPRFSIVEENAGRPGPSIDALMVSAAEVYGEKTVGILLSGMGRDGVEGMKGIKNAGGWTIAQDESALIFGMPKAVIDAGYASEILPVGKMPRALEAHWAKRETSPNLKGASHAH
ncbi:MAG: chemotaxis-specific protein-glutamate methyltransferase CheB [Elusimicrobia bacterium]|nr:chemotaxis-specific protein-glutamate methyltransferase CheB [Candidatus Obscuribacterium magneticum]